MSDLSIRNTVMSILRPEAFRQFNPYGRGPESFATRVRGYLARRAVRAIQRLLPSHAIRVIQELDKDQRDPEYLIDFLFTRLLGVIKPSQIRSEITALAWFVKELKPKTVLEIGTNNGGSLFLSTRLADPEATVVSIDLPGGVYGGGYPDWRIPLYKSFSLPKQSMHLIRADSHAAETLEKVKSIFGGEPVDYLFIDADHTYEGVKKDFEFYSPLVGLGGAIAFHDIVPHPPALNCGVDRLWNEIKRPESKEFVENIKQGWAGIGIF